MLILDNGLPGQSSWGSPEKSDSATAAPNGYLPPHLLTASQAEKQDYLSRHKDHEQTPISSPAKPRKKLTQAERKKGASNQVDLSKPNPDFESNDAIHTQSPVEPDHRKGSMLNGQNSSSQPIPAAVPPHLACFSGGIPAQTQVGAPSTVVNLPRIPPQSSAGLAPSPAGPSNSPQRPANSPARGGHFPTGPNHSQNIFTRQPAPGPHYTGHHRAFSGQPRGNYQAPPNGKLPHQPSRNFPPQTSAQHFPPATFTQHPNTQHFSYHRPSLPPNRQLFNPNPQQFQSSDPQEVHVPGRMQVDYLEHLAAAEIGKAEITSEELQEKENFRLELHNVCQWAVTAFEQKKDASFDARTVAMKCFGSLSSGFATRGSDMDLVLVSPKSIPDATSPDSEIPRLLEKVLLNEGYGARLLTRTRVPIIRLCEKPTPALMKALLEERVKWENDRDLAAAQKLDKKQKKDAKTKRAKNTGKPPGKTTPHTPMASSDAQEAAQCASDSSSAKSDQHEDDHLLEEGDTPLSIHAQDLEKLIDSSGQGLNGMYLAEGRESKTEAEESNWIAPGDETEKATVEDKLSPQDIPQLDGREAGPVLKTKKAPQETPVDKVKAARPRPPQPVRTDEELVRLYVLAMTEGWFNDAERKIIYRFVNSANKPSASSGRQELDEARTALNSLPDVLSRYRERVPDTHLDFPKDGVGIQCDINFSNHLALHNTQLLRCYSHCDPRVRPMVLFVKAWAKKRKINSPYHGTLSSYGYVLMVLHYLINIAAPPVVPNLQLSWQASPKESVDDQLCNGSDIRFWRAEKDIRLAANRGMLTENRQPLGFLLRGFFQYYAQEGRGVPCGGFSWSRSVVSIRTNGGLLSKQEKGWVEARTEIVEPVVAGQKPKEIKHRYLLAIEDPFELEHNVARPVAHHGICAIRDEFRRANRLIQNAGSIVGVKVDLFEEGQEHVQERTFFGPNPARFTRSRRFGPQSQTTPNGKAEGQPGASVVKVERQQGTTNGDGGKQDRKKVSFTEASIAKPGTAVVETGGETDKVIAAADDEGCLGIVSDAGVGDEDVEVIDDYKQVVGSDEQVVHVPGSPQSLNEDMRG